MTDEEIKDRITEHKECCKKLAEEYRQRYNEDRTDKLALNMFYHNVIAYNNYEDILAMIEDRNSMILCFAEPPILTEKTVEVDLNKMAKLEKENAELKEKLKCAEHNCKVKQEFNDNQFNAIMKLKDEFTKSLTYAKSIVKDLLDNSDEYAKQRAKEFLEENLK